MDEESQSQPTFGTPPAPVRDSDPYAPGLPRKVLFSLLGVLALIFATGSAWIGYEVATGSAIDRLGKAAATPAPAMPAAAVAPAPAGAASPAATPTTPTMPAMPAAPYTSAAPADTVAGPSAPPALPSADELLAEKKRPATTQAAPAALVRDLPDWLASEVGARGRPGARATTDSSGGSADESARPRDGGAEQKGAQSRHHERPEPQQRAATVFARCPKPGVAGAVECRRDVCAGAARKQDACAAYLN